MLMHAQKPQAICFLHHLPSAICHVRKYRMHLNKMLIHAQIPQAVSKNADAFADTASHLTGG